MTVAQRTASLRATHARSAVIGLRARTGRAIAVVLAGSRANPEPVSRSEIVLATAGARALYQPFHQVLDLPWERAAASVHPAERALENAAATELSALVRVLGARGLNANAVGIVGAPDRNLAAIGSSHIRAHAAEGVLFRHVWQVAAAANALECAAFPERDIESLASNRLGLAIAAIEPSLAAFGRMLGRPWRADEKAAALAAWLVLA